MFTQNIHARLQECTPKKNNLKISENIKITKKHFNH